MNERYYWFEPADGVLGFKDGRKPEAGVTHTVEGTPVLCKHGLHASRRALDALEYARSSVIWIIELGGVVVHGDDKSAATERTYIKRADIESVLREFARWCALQVIDQWDAPDVVRQYLETGDESLRAAAWAAAGAAAGDAAWAAAWAAAGDAAGGAAWAAAGGAARDAWSAAGDKLEAMIAEVMK